MSDKTVTVKVLKTAIKNKYLPVLIGIFLGSLVAVLWSALENHDNANRIKTVDAQALKIAEIISVDLDNRIKSLQRVIKRWEIRGGTPKDEFIKDAQSYILDDPGYQALSWVDKTYHVRWIIPLAGNEAALDLNLAFEESRRIALEKAKARKLPTLTSPINLVQGGKGFLVYFPIFVNGEFEGFISAVFRTQEWLDHILRKRLSGKDEVYFRNWVSMDNQQIFGSVGADKQQGTSQLIVVDKLIYGHQFSVQSRPSELLISQNYSLLPELVLCLGIIFSVLISMIVYLVQRANIAINTITSSKVALESEISVRKETQESLIEERKRLNYILEGTNAGTWEWNVQTGDTIFNQRWANIVGYTLAELQPTSIDTWQRLVHPDDLKISGKLLAEHFAGKLDYYESESRMRHKDGHWIWVLDRGKIFTWTDDGKPLLMFGTHSDITRQKEIEEKNYHCANHDALTNLPSLRLANDRISMAIEMAKRNNTMAGFIFVDLDGFKDINDTYGHSAGDTLLKVVAKRLLSSLRKTDTVARIGGDEFLLIITDVHSEQVASLIAEKTLETIAKPVPLKGGELIIGASLGIAIFPSDGDSAETLIKNADEAMYVSKNSGRNRYTFSQEAGSELSIL